MLEPNANYKIRIAFKAESDGVVEIWVDDIERLLRNPERKHLYLAAEYVELDSQYVSHADIRRHGYSCRAFA